MTIAFLFFALLLLSCDEIANQLEDPFYSLPLADIAKTAEGHMQRTIKELKSLYKAELDEAARVEKLKRLHGGVELPVTHPGPPEF